MKGARSLYVRILAILCGTLLLSLMALAGVSVWLRKSQATGAAGGLPYGAVVLAALFMLWWWLTLSIAMPLRDLAAAADRIGRGQLLPAGTPHQARRDEIGELARSLERSATRIHALGAAEQRLMQDISHELRAPLTRLTVAIELFRQTPDRTRAALQMQEEVDRLARTVESLMEAAGAESDPARDVSTVVDLWVLLRQSAGSCEIEARARGCRLVLTRQAPGVIRGHAELLRRAFDNVIRNAIRFAPAGSAVDVDLAGGATAVVISVRDYGPGVPADALPHLATPFFRVQRAGDAAGGGIGLGLAIAKRALDVHRAAFAVENAGPGLRIRMTFPHGAASDSEPRTG